MIKKGIILLIISLTVIFTACGTRPKTVKIPANNGVSSTTITQEEKALVEEIARAVAKKAGDDKPQEITFKADTEEVNKEPIYLVTVKGTMQDVWSGTNKYAKELNFSIIQKTKQIFFIWGTNDGQLVWQKSFNPVSWKLLSS